MKRTIQKFVVAVAMLLLSLSASAYDFEVGGLYYEIISPTELTCGVTFGPGYYRDVVNIPSEVSYNGETYSVISIGNYAFEYSGLTSVTIPNSVTEIGVSAFSGCTGLTSVAIPNSVTTIEIEAFSKCTGLTSVTIPNSVTAIGPEAFEGCTGLISATISNSVIESSEFEGCTGLTSVNISNSVTAIGPEAFSGCTGLTSVTIPNSVTTIVEKAFSGCTGLTSLEIPSSLREIVTSKDGSFDGCVNITKLAFLGDENASFDLITFGGNDASPFSDLKLEELYLGCIVADEYGNIYDDISDRYTYPRLDTLKKITFGKYLEEVGSGLYGHISTIPTTAEIYCESLTPPDLVPPSYGGDSFTDQQYSSIVLHVPAEALEAYKQAEGWKNFWNIKAYDTVSGVEDVSIDDVSADVFKVYNLAGMLVKETADKTEAYDLPSGIYIINGRKVAIR